MELKYSSDLWFSAFLMLKGYKIENFIQIGKGKVKCGFNLTDEDWQKLKLDFNNSELVKYKTVIGQIKDLSF